MDRFEDWEEKYHELDESIYIPVWIDLKLAPTTMQQSVSLFTFQYG